MYTKTFKEITKKDVGIAGGKGASLGEMTNAGISVPQGYIILVDAFDRYLEETGLVAEIASQIKDMNFEDINSVDKASNVIRDLISDTPIPEELKKVFLEEFKKLNAKYVAVRSSATAEDGSIASWAGELETYLNTSSTNLMDNIKNCWSSLFTPRALSYAFEKKVITIGNQRKIRANTCRKLAHCYPVGVAVVVQKMIQSEISGICFTAHPVTQDLNQMVIETGWGLGEAIVGGKITPDTYIIDKKTWAIIDANISDQEMMMIRDGSGIKEIVVSEKIQSIQKLENKQIIKLAKFCQKIEEHYKHPQDIEFAISENKIYITQSRPITTL